MGAVSYDDGEKAHPISSGTVHILESMSAFPFVGGGDLGTLHPTLVEIVHKLFRVPDARLVPGTLYTDIPGWDSLSQINLIFEVEKNFGFRFDDEELEQVRASATLDELQALLRAKLSELESRSA
jgi:acyl carrier protein